MSQTDTGCTLTEDERATFERLANHYEGEPIADFFEAVLQSDDSEEANS